MDVLAVDIGGTHLRAATVSDAGEISGASSVRTPRRTDSEAVFRTLVGVIDDVLRAAGDRRHVGMGVASAGPIDAGTGVVSPVNIAAWRGFPLRRRLAERYRLPVTVFGDAVAAVRAEHWLGAARGCDHVLGMVVSTGVGGGLILDGQVRAGATANAGHIGHLPVDPQGPECACGGVGCLEAVASGTAIASWASAQARRRTADERDASAAPGVRTPGAGRRFFDSAAEVAEAARGGDDVARAAFDRAGAALGRAIAGVVTVLDLDIVVIGGGVATGAFDLLRPPLESSYRRHAALSYAANVRVVPAALGDHAGLLGAAAAVNTPQ